MSITAWIVFILAAYLLGSLPVGVLLGRTRGIDIRQHGSRNVGATNVTRVLGKRLGMLCLLLDLLKGAIPVVAAGVTADIFSRRAWSPVPSQIIATGDLWWWTAVAASAVLGHCASIFLGFRGGKGVATTFGALLAMWNVLTLPALGALVVWYLIRRVTGYVSVASITASVSLPVWYLASLIPPSGSDAAVVIAHGCPPLIVTAGLAVLVIWRHQGNIARLRRGEEPRGGGEGARE